MDLMWETGVRRILGNSTATRQHQHGEQGCHGSWAGLAPSSHTPRTPWGEGPLSSLLYFQFLKSFTLFLIMSVCVEGEVHMRAGAQRGQRHWIPWSWAYRGFELGSRLHSSASVVYCSSLLSHLPSLCPLHFTDKRSGVPGLSCVPRTQSDGPGSERVLSLSGSYSGLGS